MIAQQILLDEPASALPVGAEEDGDAVVDDDGQSRAHDRSRMSAGTICSGEDIIQSCFHNHTGAVIFGKSQKLLAEPVSVADDRVNEVLVRLSLDRDFVLQTGEGIVPRR